MPKEDLTIEAPPPCTVSRKNAANERSNDRTDSQRGANEPRVQAAFPQRDVFRYDDEHTGNDTCATYSGDGSADDQSHTVWCSTTDCASNQKDEHRKQIRPFRIQ